MMTHAELVEKGRAWLAKKCPVVLSELVSAAGETPDVIGFEGRVVESGYGSHLIECKTSRTDFRADANKYWRLYPENGMGDYRYYLTVQGLLSMGELPDKWGLLEITKGGRIKIVVVPMRQEANKRREIALLVSTMRRIKFSDGEHCSLRIKSYTIESTNKAVLEINNNITSPAGEGE